MSDAISTAQQPSTREPGSRAAFRRVGVLRLSWPLLVVTLVTLLAVIADTVILSQGSAALNAAISNANQILGIPYDLSVLFSIGALVVIAQLLGADRLSAARRATIIALRANALLGLVIAGVISVLAPWLVGVVNTPDAIADDSLVYLYTVLGGVVCNAYIVVATAILRAWGRTVPILVIGILLNVSYLALQYLFILVLELGPAGAALSTTIARGGAVVLVALVIWRRTGVHLFSRLPPREPGVAATAMARLSVPTVVENALYNVGILVLVSFINLLGEDAINARSYALTLTALVTGIALALAQANETVVGWDAGAHRPGHAHVVTLRTAGWAALVSCVLAVLLWLGADSVLSIFDPNAAVLLGAKEVLLLSVVLLPLAAGSAVVYGALRSTGDVVVPMLYSVGASVLLLIPLAWLFVGALGWGLAGAWLALICAEGVKVALLLTRWLRGAWKQRTSVADELQV